MTPLNTDAPRSPSPSPRKRSVLSLIVALVVGAGIGWAIVRGLDRLAPTASQPRPVTPRGDLAADEKSTIELFRRASPSVVFITTLQQQVDYWTQDVMEIPQGTGSGFIWDEAGHVVTNYHVLKGASAARITLADASSYPAELVGVAPQFDLAVLRIRAPKKKLRPILVGQSRTLLVGQKVLAIGNPFGLDQTLTTGIVSALGRSIRTKTGHTIEEMIQTDAAINPGNSGGPLLDSAGRLIGVNTAIYSPSGSSAGIGFAVPVDTVNRVVPELIAKGRLARAELGVRLNDPIGLRLTRQVGIEGALVLGVVPGSPAAAAGLRPTRRTPDGVINLGDVIQGIDGQLVRSAQELLRVLERRRPGDQVKLTVLRDGEQLRLEVTLREAATTRR